MSPHRQLAFLVAAARRLMLPGARRSVIVFPEERIAYFRVPKAANSSVKAALYALLPPDDRPAAGATHPDGTPRAVNQDSFWLEAERHGVRFQSPAAFARAREGIFSFTFVRNPFARVVSAYYDKIGLRGEVFEPFAKLGMTAETGFPGFVSQIASIPDAMADVHFRSQASFVCHRGTPLPDFVGRVETIGTDWPEIVRRAEAAGGPRLPDLGRLRRTARKRPRVREVLSAHPETVERILARYRTDFDLFYPDREIPKD